MQVGLLGPLTVSIDGREVAPKQPKRRALLALLALHAGEVVPAERLVEALWGEQPPPSATNALQGHVSALRKLLGSSRIETRQNGYCLRLDANELDIHRLEGLLQQCRTEAPARRADVAAKALSLFRGEPLADFRYETFAAAESARLEELRLVAVEERIDAELELGRHSDVVPELKQLLATDPLRERLHGQLMLALYRSARQAEALDVYRGLRAVLADQLGLEPTPDIQELNRAILAQDPALALGNRTPAALDNLARSDLAGDGSRARLASVTGDAVNIAAWLERVASPGEILLGEATYRLVRDAVEVEPFQPLDLEAMADPVTAYRLLDVRHVAAARARRLDSPIVGRAREQALLRQAFQRSVDERSCHLFTTLGSAGVGKSRLVDEFIREVESDATVLQSRCLPYGDGITFWPIAEVLRALGATSAVAIARLVSPEEPADLVGSRLAVGIGLEPGTATAEETFWAFRTLLETLARRRPLVLVLDDLQWGESTFLDLVDHIADWARDAPILVTCMARPELLDERPAWGGGKFNATSVLLEPLPERDCRQLIDNLLGQTRLAREACDRLMDAAEGNPLFIEELLAMLIDERLLERRNGTWVAAGDLSAIVVPPTIQALLAARLDHLAEEERIVIQLASVEGRVFHRGAVAELAPDSLEPRVASCLATLVRKELVRRDRTEFPGEDAFRFRHLLIRDVAYDALPKERRAELHERFAVWLEARQDEHATKYEEILGYHLEQAYRYRQELGPLDETAEAVGRRAAERLGVAGRRALDRMDMPAAANLLERAASLPSADAQRLSLILDLAVALIGSGRLPDANERLSKAIEASRGDKRTEFLARVHLAFARALTTPERRFEEVGNEARAAIAVFEELGDDAGLARAWHLAGLNDMWAGRAASAEANLERARVHARVAGDRRQATESLLWMTGAWFFGPRAAPDVERRIADMIHESGDWRVEAWASTVLSEVAAMQGRLNDGRGLRERAKALFNEFGLLLEQTWASHFFGRVEILACDIGAAEAELRQGIEISRQIGETGHRSTTISILADVVYEAGRYQEALELSQEAEEVASADDIFTQVLWRAARAKALARIGQLETAERLAGEALSLIRRTDDIGHTAAVLGAKAETLRLAGRDEEARTALEEALELYERKGNVVMAGRTGTALRGFGLGS